MTGGAVEEWLARLDTHGRWPLVAAAAVVPAGAAAVRDARLRPLAALLAHQCEEWVWPGGFLPWVNREVFGSDLDEWPLGRHAGLVVNVVVGWSLSLVAGFGSGAVVPATALHVTHLANLGLHGGWAWRHRRYDPGSVTACLTLTPVAVGGLLGLVRDPAVDRRDLVTGVAIGVGLSAGLPLLLRTRVRRRGAAAG